MGQLQSNLFKVHQVFFSLQPPPQPEGNSMTPLLPSSTGSDEDDTEAQRKPDVPASTPLTVMAIVKFFIIMAPLLATFLSFGVLVGTGVDPLGFSMLALYLILALLVYVVAVVEIQIQIGKRRGDPPHQRWVIKDWKHLLYLTLSIYGIYWMFYGLIWMWATVSDDGNDNGLPSPWHIFIVSRDLQVKIGGPSSIEALGTCLQEAIPHRNATIEDISRCLKGMGMNETYVPWE